MKKRNIGAAVAFCGAAVNLALFLVKLYVAVSCNSLSIYLDSFNNAVDCLVCVFVGLGFILSKKGATKDYPFGFGKTEGVVNFLVCVIILVTGLSFAYSSLGRIMYPLPIWYSSKYAAMVALTLPVKLLLFFLYKRSNKKLSSPVLDALSFDSILDLFITLCSLTALFVSNRLGFSADGFSGMVISVILVFQSIKIVKNAFGTVIGKRDSSLCEKIENAVSQIGLPVTVENVTCHVYGEKIIANLTLDLNGTELSKETVERIRNALSPETVSDVYINIGGKGND